MFEPVALIVDGNLHFCVVIAADSYPHGATGRSEIRWYRNDDVTIHYPEEHRASMWKYCWDCHQNSHNSREHFHPPPAMGRTNAEHAQ